MEINGAAAWAIKSVEGAASAVFVPEFGGIGASLKLEGPKGLEELLYQHPFFWDRATRETRGGSPFCFPICGRLNRDGVSSYEVDGRVYSMDIHGFAMHEPWSVLHAGEEDRIVLGLTENEQTFAMFPFAFELRLEHRIEPSALVTTFTCVNRSDRPMPYYAGFHPYLATPEAHAGKSEVLVQLPAEEQLLYNGDLTQVTGRKQAARFPLPISSSDVNEMLHRIQPGGECVLRRADGVELVVQVQGTSDPSLFSYVQMYTMAERPFFCVEPWMGYPNQMNEPGTVHVLEPGAKDEAVCRIALR